MRRSLSISLALVATLVACSDEAGEVDQPSDVLRSDQDTTDSSSDVAADLETGTDSDVAPPTCNGHAHLCERSVDQVLFPTTHNSMAAQEHQFIAPNHRFGIPTQLEDGIRGFMLDLHYDGDEPALCHSFCSGGRMALVDGFGNFTEFLSSNPREVIVLIFESYVEPADIEEQLAASGLLDHVHSHTPGEPWETLGELIDNGEQVVVLTDDDGDPPWAVPVWDVAWDTDWNNHSADELDCERNRGSADNELFIMNNFIYNQPPAELPLPSLAEQVNANPFLIDRVSRCHEELGQLPNFIAVDFYSIGDLLDVADTVNQWPVDLGD